MTEIADKTSVKIGKRRPRFTTTAANRKNHVMNWRQSGINKSDYARQHGIPVSCFNKWTMSAERGMRSTFKAARVVHSSPTPRQPSPDTDTIEILVGQSILVRLTSRCDPSVIVEIIRGLTHAAGH